MLTSLRRNAQLQPKADVLKIKTKVLETTDGR